jgi:hypothetical protein
LIVEAFTKNGLPLMVIGDGPDMKKVAKLAGKNVTMLGYQSQEKMTELMQQIVREHQGTLSHSCAFSMLGRVKMIC